MSYAAVMKHADTTFKVYVKPGCPWCVEVIDYLEAGGYEFEAIDVRADAAAYRKMQEISGQTSAPTMTVGDLMLADFGVAELVPFLKKHSLFK